MHPHIPRTFGSRPGGHAVRALLLSATCLIGLTLAGCERRPTDPPKPTAQLGVTPATAGIAGMSDSAGRAPVALSPASDPPPSPIPQPAEPPASPASR